MNNNLEMRFDPRTIEHLGVKMYSTLPPALAELISNAYDADAENVSLRFSEVGSDKSIYVLDDGTGMSADEIQNRFLVIGRNRRSDVGDTPSPRFKRLATGKKGLGKLALFGLAKKITIDTIKNGRRNRFNLDWDKLLNSDGTYNPEVEIYNKMTDKRNGTTITLAKLKRQSPFDLDAIANNLSKIFIVDNDFKISLTNNEGDVVNITTGRRYEGFVKQFSWILDDFIDDESKFKGRLTGEFFTSDYPIKPNSGLRGVSLFSRGKLVNAPEYFSSSTSSHFFQYLTGWISADFIDLLPEDVISTNRQSVDWDNPDMKELRDFLSDVISKINSSWRTKRKEDKTLQFTQSSGIDTEKWMSTLPHDIRQNTQSILNKLADEEAIEQFAPVVKALYNIVPEYPLLHWRHLNSKLKDRIQPLYINGQYAFAADQGVKIYSDLLRELTGLDKDGVALMQHVWSENNPMLTISDLTTDSGRNIQKGQLSLAKGVVEAFRNPFNHTPMDKFTESVYSELDCLNILSLISYLSERLEHLRNKNDDKS
ncbi:TIGR02391 family protein [Pantoea sp. SO10]|uniref:TIGR02391 family protein n=1 Tax=Pantoea sp. SO10 TaxID=2575375 RepID=UPI0010C99238|nr:TIGR02391 family protein [Pantoea sp. SO10]QCP60984.1 TIGR02391 family protein [Pantoea sp. SO10]